MYSLINTNFNRTYNPSGSKNALSDIKRLLTSRDTAAQTKACGYLCEVINRYNRSSEEGARMIDYLLDNDITVFLCEATSNLDFMLFRSILSCLRLLWRCRRFYLEEHAAHSMTAVLRALAHYGASGPASAVEACFCFLCELLKGISTHKTTSALSHQSAYSAIQLLSCLNTLIAPTNSNVVLSSALVLDALISYQPENLIINADTAIALSEVVTKWFELLMGALNHAVLVGGEDSGMFYVVACELGANALRLTKVMRQETKVNFVQTILTDDHEVGTLKKCAFDIYGAVQRVISELVMFTKEHQTTISTEEYRVFLKFLLNFFYDSASFDILPDFCDMLLSIGYLTMLPQVQIMRNEISIRKASTLVLGELLKVLADKYLNVCNSNNSTCVNDIHMGLVELQYGIEKPQSIGVQLQKGQPYSLLIYIYFHCLSSDSFCQHFSPDEATAPLLPYLVEHILKLPKSFQPPPYIKKALWLVFAMSSLSNRSQQSLEERVYLEKATDRLISMLKPDPSIYYTHNPAILLWAFTSHRNYVRFYVLSQWLKLENSIPIELTTMPIIWELLLNILIQSTDEIVVENCMTCLHSCLDEGSESVKDEFAGLVWSMLSNVLSKMLIASNINVDTNVIYILDLATILLPPELDQTLCLEIALQITAIFTKNGTANDDVTNNKTHFEYVCLKLSLYLLGLAHNQNDNRVLSTYINRTGFLPAVLAASNSADERLACAALQLLSYIVHYFTKNHYQPKSILEIRPQAILQSLRRDSTNERGASILQLVYMVLNTVNSPLALALDMAPGLDGQCSALRALMFRIQLMLCRRDSKDQSSAGWKTLSSIFKHAIVAKNDPNLVAILTTQPWMHILIQYQTTQHITPEFLTFIQNWVTLLRITIKKSQEDNKIQLSKHSLVIKTMIVLRKLTAEESLKDIADKINVIAKDVLEDNGIKYK